MKKMSSKEIRESWINFFENKNHLFLEPVSLIPNNDPSLLWINSGVSTLKKYFSGQENPPSKRLVNYQKSIRTNDIYNVGKTSRHQTLFEMLGNFSIGDYFKKEAIEFAYELLINEWKIDKEKLWITTFEEDHEVYEIWKNLGINSKKILKCNRERNFWDIGNGPCGGCTEIFYDRGPEFDLENIGEELIIKDIENDRFIEIWNLVFSEFNNNGDNTYTELKRKNIDTGAGLERIACISQNVLTNFDTDLFNNVIKEIEKYSNLKYKSEIGMKISKDQKKNNFLYRVIVDHFRAVIFAIADGATPSNKDRGYIIRRLIRRGMVCLSRLKLFDFKYIEIIVSKFIENLEFHYSYLKDKKNNIINVLKKEFSIFNKTLNNGLLFLESSIINNKISSDNVFLLVTTYGFPIELIEEILNEKNIKFDFQEYEKLFNEHQKISNKRSDLIKGMENQNSILLDINTGSKFNYNKTEIKTKVSLLLNKNFELTDSLNNEEGYIIFDETPFYATSGGQKHDIGYVNNNQFIDSVIKTPNLEHLHHSNSFNLKKNQEVILSIDKKNRNKTTIHHSTEHLLHASLKLNISKDIKQEGAFKSGEKITFDFQNYNKLTIEELQKIEDWINEQIKKELPVTVLMMTLEEAKKMNATAYFEDVYKKISTKLRVIKIGDVSLELCGGTHISNTKEIYKFNIISFKSKGSGTWRIEGTSGEENIDNFKQEMKNKFISEISKLNIDYQEIINNIDKKIKKVSLFKIPSIIENEKNKLVNLEKEKKLSNTKKLISSYISKINTIDSFNILVYFSIFDSELSKQFVSEFTNIFPKKTLMLIFEENNTKRIILSTNKKNNISVKEIIGNIADDNLKIKFGGNDKYIQGGIQTNYSKDQIINKIIKNGFKLCE